MGKFIISEAEKKAILDRYYPEKIVNEGIVPKINLGKIFGQSVDDIFKGFGDDAIKSLDDVFAKVFKNPKNLATAGTQKVLMSASGAQIPLETVKNAIEAVAKGKLQANQVLNYLPRQLADGTEFRAVVGNALEKKGVTAAAGAASGAAVQTAFKSGQGITQNFIKNNANKINWANITNAKTADEYNKLIANAIRTGDYSRISRSGFESLGIPNFREFLRTSKNLEANVMASPTTGQWFFTVK